MNENTYHISVEIFRKGRASRVGFVPETKTPIEDRYLTAHVVNVHQEIFKNDRWSRWGENHVARFTFRLSTDPMMSACEITFTLGHKLDAISLFNKIETVRRLAQNHIE